MNRLIEEYRLAQPNDLVTGLCQGQELGTAQPDILPLASFCKLRSQ